MLERLGELAGKAAEGGVEAILTWLTGVVLTALFDALQWLGTWWLSIEAPGMGEGSAAARAVDATKPLLPLFGVIGMAFGCIRIARDQNRGAVEGLIASMLRSVAAVAIALTATSVGLEFGTEISPWLVERIGGEEVEEGLAQVLGLQAMMSGIQGSAALAVIVLVLAFVALLGSLINAFLVLFSYGMAAVLAGLLAFFAAVSTTDKGKKSFDKVLSWLIAVVLFKPVAAIIWGVGLALAKGYVGEGGEKESMDQLVGLLVGLVMVVGASLALPGLARVAAPMVAEGPRGMGAGSLLAGAGALAVGALAAGATAGVGAFAGAGAGAKASGAGGAMSGGGGFTSRAISGSNGGTAGGTSGGTGGGGGSTSGGTGGGTASGTSDGTGGGTAGGTSGGASSPSGGVSGAGGGAESGSSGTGNQGQNVASGGSSEPGSGGTRGGTSGGSSAPSTAGGGSRAGSGDGGGSGPSGASPQGAEAGVNAAGAASRATGSSPGSAGRGTADQLREAGGPEGAPNQTGSASGARASFLRGAVRTAGYEARRMTDDASGSMESGE